MTHRQALPHKDVAAAIETVRGSTSAQPAVRLAFEFLVLTAARSGEVRLATWDEMDAACAVWTTSAKREHRVRSAAGRWRYTRRSAIAATRSNTTSGSGSRRGEVGLDVTMACIIGMIW